MINYDELDPGVRELVRLLNANGFPTCDSGDGYSKDEDARVLDRPHAIISLDDADSIVSECDRLIYLMASHGVEIVRQGPPDDKTPCIQADYDPISRNAYIMLMDVLDSDLEGV